ncbi:hypothetical protein GN958_ATG13483, partial [Phytophthora infestans]
SPVNKTMAKTRAQSSTAPPDDAVGAGASVFTPLLPARITSTSHAALVKWRKERRGYEDTRNRAKGEMGDLVVSIKNTFDGGLFRQWCHLRLKISIDDVTDALILEEVDKIISSVKTIHEMAEQLRMVLNESDVHKRVIQYFMLCHDIIDDHGWRIFFNGKDGRKQLCRILMKSLEPKSLREKVDRTTRFQTRKAKEDEVVLHDLILEKALDIEKFYQNQRRAKRSRGEREAESPTHSLLARSCQINEIIERIEQGLPLNRRQSTRKSLWLHAPTPSECPAAAEAEKAKVRRKMQAKRGEGSKREVARLKRLRKYLTLAEKTVTLNEVLELPYCVDTGTDRTAISRKHVDELLLHDSSIKLARLSIRVVN